MMYERANVLINIWHTETESNTDQTECLKKFNKPLLTDTNTGFPKLFCHPINEFHVSSYETIYSCHVKEMVEFIMSRITAAYLLMFNSKALIAFDNCHLWLFY